MENQLNIPEVTEQVVELDDRLLVLRFNLGKLRAALERAFAPVAASILPMVNTAVRAITDLVKDAGWLLAALFGQVRTDTKTTTKTVSGSLKRALADIDRLDRLNLGGGGGSITVEVPKALQEIPQKFKDMADRIRAFLKPLQELDFSAACAALGRLKEAIAPFTRTLLSGLEWLWYDLLTPMAAWTVEQALPAFLDVLGSGLQVLNSVISTAKPMLSWLWNDMLVPLGQWAGQNVLNALGLLSQALQTLAGWVANLKPMAEALAQKLAGLGQKLIALGGDMSIFTHDYGNLGLGLGLLVQLAQQLGLSFEKVGQVVAGLGQKIKTLLTDLAPMFQSVANVAIGMVNLAINGMEAAINAMVKALNRLDFEVPKWVPGLGGKKFGLGLKTVDLPNVPYLAQGAVLPPNKPFLAVVGDQRSGTNVEAPLATIQQAVAEVLGATGQDTNRLLAQILTAIGAIEVGDDTIGRAARRYESRMALMGGSI